MALFIGEMGKAFKNKSEKSALKLSIKIMTCSPSTLRQTEGEKVEAMTNFIFLGSKIIADSDCSLEVKRHLLLGRKAMNS